MWIAGTLKHRFEQMHDRSNRRWFLACCVVLYGSFAAMVGMAYYQLGQRVLLGVFGLHVKVID